MEMHTTRIATLLAAVLLSAPTFAADVGNTPAPAVPLVTGPAAPGSAAQNGSEFDAFALKQALNSKVLTSDGVRVGTVESATTSPDGVYFTVHPAYESGLPLFQVPATTAVLANEQVTLTMSANAIRAALTGKSGNA